MVVKWHGIQARDESDPVNGAMTRDKIQRKRWRHRWYI